MMPSDADLAQIAQNLYSEQPPGYWTAIWPHDCGMAALYRWQDHYDVVVWRGSATLDDWLADLNAEPVPDSILGPVHHGFRQGVLDLAPQILHAIARPAIIIGHSLGAGHALIHAGYLYKANEDVQRVVTWGSPRPGCQPLAQILSHAPGRDYKNRSDPVTTVPFGMGYVHPRIMFPVDVEPDLGDSFGLLADHHMKYYLTAMEGLT